MTQEQRRRLTISQVVLIAAVVVLAMGYAVDGATQVAGVSQDAINATLTEQNHSQDARLDRLERMLEYGMGGLMANLIAHLFQIQALRRGR